VKHERKRELKWKEGKETNHYSLPHFLKEWCNERWTKDQSEKKVMKWSESTLLSHFVLFHLSLHSILFKRKWKGTKFTILFISLFIRFTSCFHSHYIISEPNKRANERWMKWIVFFSFLLSLLLPPLFLLSSFFTSFHSFQTEKG